jgi:hypothetical protein
MASMGESDLVDWHVLQWQGSSFFTSFSPFCTYIAIYWIWDLMQSSLNPHECCGTRPLPRHKIARYCTGTKTNIDAAKLYFSSFCMQKRVPLGRHDVILLFHPFYPPYPHGSLLSLLIHNSALNASLKRARLNPCSFYFTARNFNLFSQTKATGNARPIIVQGFGYSLHNWAN